MVRDLDSGEVSQIAEQPEQNCRFSVSGVSARRVVTTETCSKRDGQARLSDDGTVWSLDGGPTIEFPGNSMMFGGLADDRVLFQLYSGNGDLATYAYSFDTAEVLELGTVTTDEFGSQDQWPTRASGDRVTFPSPETKGHLALVELRP